MAETAVGANDNAVEPSARASRGAGDLHGQVAERSSSRERLGSEIRIEEVTRRFGQFAALDNVSLTIAPGEFVTLLGPSGSGKTTLLGTIAGFQPINKGAILVDGSPIQNVPPHRRGFGMVFQNYALFPHMTVGQNVAFPLRMSGMRRSESDRRVRETLQILKLETFVDRLPGQLSGGQQQRVAIARAIVKRPKVVLMDEPLSALDRRLRESIQLEIRELHQTIGTTIIFVTHDQGEALALSDRVAVLDAGKIVQVGTPGQLYRRPANTFVAGFLGESNLIKARVVERQGDVVVLVGAAGFRFEADAGTRSARIGDEVTALVRPERIGVLPAGQSPIEATVRGVVYLGEILRIDAMLSSGEPIQIRCIDSATMPNPRPGETIGLAWTAVDCWVIK